MLLLTGCLLCSTLPAHAQGWWSVDYPHRRAVRVQAFDPTGLDGDDIAVVTFLTGGQAQADGRDVRVVAADGTEMPREIIAAGPGDEMNVAFALRGKIRDYKVYWGNANAPPPARPLEIKRGVLMETWAYPGGNANNGKEFQAVWDKARQQPAIGRGFQPRVFIGHNPFGPQDKIVSRFSAYLLCPQAGEYRLGLQTNCASVLRVDGKVQVKSFGWHGPRRLKQAVVNLPKGLVHVEVAHVNPWSNPIVVVGWQPPGGDKLAVISPKDFAPAFDAQAGPMEDYGLTTSVDFRIADAGEAFLAERYLQRRVFEAQVARGPGAMQFEWDFGDGQRATGETVEHVFLSPGTYKVTLRTRGAAPVVRTHTLVIDRRWDHVTDRTLDPLKACADIAANYDFATLVPAANAQAVRLFDRVGRTPLMFKAGRALLSRARVSPDDVGDVVPMLVAAWQHAGDADQAAYACQKAAHLTPDATTTARMLNLAAAVRLEQGQGDPAMKLYAEVLADHAAGVNDDVLRQARIGVGDVWRARGNLVEARKAYRAAGPGSEAAGKHPAITRGDLARQVEDFLRREELDAAGETLDEWARLLPGDKVEGYWSLLTMQLLLAWENYPAAIRQAELLVGVNPRSSYAPEVLLAAARAHVASKAPAEAVRVLKDIVENYGESPVSATARALLAETRPS